MLSVKDKGLLLHIIDHRNRILKKIDGLSKQNFDSDEGIQEIICFNIFQIGELTKKLSKDFIQTYSKMPWSDIKGMRDVIGHGYGTIKMDDVWKTATEDIEPLKNYCEEIIDSNK